MIIAGAGGAAHLAGVVAAKTTLPVIGVPMPSALNGLDSLLSIVQMPKGCRSRRWRLGKAARPMRVCSRPQILALSDAQALERLTKWRAARAQDCSRNFQQLKPSKRFARRNGCLCARKREIDTPALLLDLDVMEENLRAMAAFFASRPQKLRPHFKTPKTPEIARRQLEAGAIGITASKLGEVEVLSRAGLGPILLANQIAGPQKIERLFRVAAEAGNHRRGRKRIECPRTRGGREARRSRH